MWRLSVSSSFPVFDVLGKGNRYNLEPGESEKNPSQRKRGSLGELLLTPIRDPQSNRKQSEVPFGKIVGPHTHLAHETTTNVRRGRDSPFPALIVLAVGSPLTRRERKRSRFFATLHPPAGCFVTGPRGTSQQQGGKRETSGRGEKNSREKKNPRPLSVPANHAYQAIAAKAKQPQFPTLVMSCVVYLPSMQSPLNGLTVICTLVVSLSRSTNRTRRQDDSSAEILVLTIPKKSPRG